MQEQMTPFIAHFKRIHTHTHKATSLTFSLQLPEMTHTFWQTSLIHFNQCLCVYGNVRVDAEHCEFAIFVRTAMLLIVQSFYALTLIVIMQNT